jgi:hypothetical protein
MQSRICLHVAYTFTCGRCQVTVTEHQEWLPSVNMAWLPLPDGWQTVGTQLYCAAHTIEVRP